MHFKFSFQAASSFRSCFGPIPIPPDWDSATPVADRRGTKNGLWRLIGGLNTLTG
jgi:hypothetical protein